MKVDIFIPENLSEITLGQYQKFLGVSEGKDLDLFVQQKMIEIFCKIDLKDVANIKYNDLQDTLVHFNDLFNDDYKLYRFFKMGSTEFGLIPKLDDMTFCEYVTLDTYMGDWKNMDKAMEVLFRPVKIKSLNKYDIEEYEPEKFDMSKMPLSAALGALVFFLPFKQRIAENYPELFNEGNSKDYSAKANFAAKWGWYQSIYGLSGGDLQKFDIVENTNVHKCLMFMAFEKEKNEIESNMIKSKMKR